jgi:hypothetical protein
MVPADGRWPQNGSMVTADGRSGGLSFEWDSQDPTADDYRLETLDYLWYPSDKHATGSMLLSSSGVRLQSRPEGLCPLRFNRSPQSETPVRLRRLHPTIRFACPRSFYLWGRTAWESRLSCSCPSLEGSRSDPSMRNSSGRGNTRSYSTTSARKCRASLWNDAEPSCPNKPSSQPRRSRDRSICSSLSRRPRFEILQDTAFTGILAYTVQTYRVQLHIIDMKLWISCGKTYFV